MMSNVVSTRWETVSRCPLCDSESTRHVPFEQIEEEYGVLRYSLCQVCGLVFQSPRMCEDGLAAFYTSGYRQIVQGTEGPTDKDLRVQYGRARQMLRFSQRHISCVRNHLDIGSSTGAVLLVFKKAYGCYSVGIEPGDAYRVFSQERSLQVVSDLADLNPDEATGFDLITMVHVLEHLPNPMRYLRRLRREWLAPGGHLLIEVPNLYGHTSLELAHLTAFSASTLRWMLQEEGYRVLALKAHGRPRSRLIPLYLTTLGQVSSELVSEQRMRPRSQCVKTCRGIGLTWSRLVTELLPRWAWLPWPEIDED